MHLTELAWPDLTAPDLDGPDLDGPDLDGPEGRTLLVPLGSVEQHGPHLPLDVDTRVAAAVVGEGVCAAPELVAAPALAYGASGEHEAFPGTVSIGTDMLAAVLVELGRSATRWAQRIVFLTGHGGNRDALVAAVALLRQEGRDAAWFPCAAPGDAHAGRTETSIMLALDPGAVRLDAAAPGATAPLAELLPAIRAGSVRTVSPSGVLGDPTGASAAEGERLLAGMVVALLAAVRRWRPGQDGQLSAETPGTPSSVPASAAR